MQKECQACGAFFETTNKLRKYCDACKKHPDKIRKEVDRAQNRAAKIIYKPELMHTNCEQCGKEIINATHCIKKWTDQIGTKHLFCSNNCMQLYHHDHSDCAWCGKNLRGNTCTKSFGNQYDLRLFCSDECYTSWYRKRAKDLGQLRVCAHCGKEFFRNSGYFCSVECSRKARQEGWTNPDKCTENKSPFLIRRETCICCNKEIAEYYDSKEEYNAKHIRYNNRIYYVCSAECKAKCMAMIEKAKQKTKKPVPKPVQKPESTIAICADCKVSYRDCVRMTSSYRLIPKGAHYNNHGVLVSCPDYKH